MNGTYNGMGRWALGEGWQPEAAQTFDYNTVDSTVSSICDRN